MAPFFSAPSAPDKLMTHDLFFMNSIALLATLGALGGFIVGLAPWVAHWIVAYLRRRSFDQQNAHKPHADTNKLLRVRLTRHVDESWRRLWSLGAIFGLFGALMGIFIMVLSFMGSHWKTGGRFDGLNWTSGRQFALYLLFELFVSASFSFAFKKS